MLPVVSTLNLNQPQIISSRRKKNEVVVAIGGSTGGARALENVLDHLPAGLPAAVLVVLHMPAGFTTQFARRLNSRARLEVKEAGNGDPVTEGTVFIAPGDYHLTENKQVLYLSSASKVHHVRPAIDIMLNSLADSHYRIVAVILTGMGKDGAVGVKRLKEQKPGSIVIVQDPKTAVITSMPEAVIAGGYYDEIVPLPDLAARIIKHVRELARENSSKGCLE